MTDVALEYERPDAGQLRGCLHWLMQYDDEPNGYVRKLRLF